MITAARKALTGASVYKEDKGRKGGLSEDTSLPESLAGTVDELCVPGSHMNHTEAYCERNEEEGDE